MTWGGGGGGGDGCKHLKSIFSPSFSVLEFPHLSLRFSFSRVPPPFPPCLLLWSSLTFPSVSPSLEFPHLSLRFSSSLPPSPFYHLSPSLSLVLSRNIVTCTALTSQVQVELNNSITNFTTVAPTRPVAQPNVAPTRPYHIKKTPLRRRRLPGPGSGL